MALCVLTLCNHLLQFGIDVSDGMHVHKKAVQDVLKEIDLPYTLFFNGLFYEYVSL